MNKEINRGVKQVIAKVLNISEGELYDEMILKTELSINSLTYIKIITAMETRFKIEFEMNDLNIDESINLISLCNLVESRLE